MDSARMERIDITPLSKSKKAGLGGLYVHEEIVHRPVRFYAVLTGEGGELSIMANTVQ